MENNGTGGREVFYECQKGGPYGHIDCPKVLESVGGYGVAVCGCGCHKSKREESK